MTAQCDLEVRKASELTVAVPRLPAMSADAIDKVRKLEAVTLANDEGVECFTEHLIHGGMYVRTIRMKAGTYITGALLKIPTTLIVSGGCIVFIGEERIELNGYNVLPGSALRKQVFAAFTDVEMTMVFPTSATTVRQAEQEFTDEYEMLLSNRQDNEVTLITGE